MVFFLTSLFSDTRICTFLHCLILPSLSLLLLYSLHSSLALFQTLLLYATSPAFLSHLSVFSYTHSDLHALLYTPFSFSPPFVVFPLFFSLPKTDFYIRPFLFFFLFHIIFFQSHAFTPYYISLLAPVFLSSFCYLFALLHFFKNYFYTQSFLLFYFTFLLSVPPIYTFLPCLAHPFICLLFTLYE